MNHIKITDCIYQLTETNGTEFANVMLIMLFPGVTLGINDIHIHQISSTVPNELPGNYFRINYCFEGRCEVKLQNGRYLYVSNDVLSLDSNPPQDYFYYPLGFYKGIQIFMDLKELKQNYPETFTVLGIDIFEIMEKYTPSQQSFIKIASNLFAEKSKEILRIWQNEALHTDDKIYQLRFILCQLLYLLMQNQAVNKERLYEISSISRSQYLIAKDCENRIMADLSQKLTIEDMASDYKISPSSLKKFFTQVFGCSISEYTQTMRMKEAIRLLHSQNLSIMQVATLVGYENQSKFSAVFKKHTGYAPLEYKRIHILKEMRKENET